MRFFNRGCKFFLLAIHYLEVLNTLLRHWPSATTVDRYTLAVYIHVTKVQDSDNIDAYRHLKIEYNI